MSNNDVILKLKKEKTGELKNRIGILKEEIKNNKEINFTYKNATMNTLIVGATGSGKTKSLILPILYSFMKKGLSGLIIDIKNDFTNDVYKIAKLTGRENDIIEIGSYKTASNINLINKLDKEELKLLMKKIIPFRPEEEKDPYWTTMGFKIIEDTIDLLFYIKKYKEDFNITLNTFYNLLIDEKFVEYIYKQFEKTPETKEKRIIKNNIESFEFHLFSVENKKKENKNNCLDVELDEELEKEKIFEKKKQKSWTLQKFTHFFKTICSGSLLEKLNNEEDNVFKLDFENLLYNENKIIVIRFDLLNSLYAGKYVSSFIKQKMISDIIKYNSNISEKERKETFILMDEFQNIVSFNKDFDDNTWFDKSRSFKCYQVISMQSLSSLYSVTDNIYQVHTLLNNCRNKFFLANEDETTIKYFNMISNSINKIKELHNLKIGEAYYYYFDLEKGEKKIELVNLNIDLYSKLEKMTN